MNTDRHLKVEKIGKTWRATYDGVTICATMSRSSCEANAEYLMQRMQPAVWRALVAPKTA